MNADVARAVRPKRVSERSKIAMPVVNPIVAPRTIAACRSRAKIFPGLAAPDSTFGIGASVEARTPEFRLTPRPKTRATVSRVCQKKWPTRVQNTENAINQIIRRFQRTSRPRDGGIACSALTYAANRHPTAAPMASPPIPSRKPPWTRNAKLPSRAPTIAPRSPTVTPAASPAAAPVETPDAFASRSCHQAKSAVPVVF